VTCIFWNAVLAPVAAINCGYTAVQSVAMVTAFLAKKRKILDYCFDDII